MSDKIKRIAEMVEYKDGNLTCHYGDGSGGGGRFPNAFERGCMQGWGLARALCLTSDKELKEMFEDFYGEEDNLDADNIINDFCYSEAWKVFQRFHDRPKVGDIVEWGDSEYDRGCSGLFGIVLSVNFEHAAILINEKTIILRPTQVLKETGKSYPEIRTALENMKWSKQEAAPDD